MLYTVGVITGLFQRMSMQVHTFIIKKNKKNYGIELADGRVIRFGEINSSTSLLSLVELLHEILEEERRIQIGYNVGRIANAAFNNIQFL